MRNDMSYWLDEAFYKCRDLNWYLEKHRFDNPEDALKEVREKFDYIFNAVCRARRDDSSRHSTGTRSEWS